MAKTGYLITVYQDINPSSPTYNQLKEEKVQDETNCPVTPPIDYSNQYLTIEAIEDCEIGFHKSSTSSNSKTIAYSYDENTWSQLRADYSAIQLSIKTGEKVMFRGNNDSYYVGSEYYLSLRLFSGKAKLYGNIMSLIYGNNFFGRTTLPDDCKFCRFSGGFVDAENLVLPATDLTTVGCYEHMFDGCTSLTTAPSVLPATTLAAYCYREMFRDCTSLVKAPELPATILKAYYCYQGMFYNCTSLVNAPALPATTLAAYCYREMFYNCTSMTTAPELPATVLAAYCYNYMFYNCTNLNYIKAMLTTPPGEGYTDNWVNGVASTGTFVKNKITTWDVTGTSGIPSGWTVINE